MIALVAAVCVLITVVAVYALFGCILGFFINWLAPVIFSAAIPHITWLGGVAIGVLILVLQGLFGSEKS